MITPESSECLYDDEATRSALTSPRDYVVDISRDYAIQPPGIVFNNLTLPPIAALVNDSYRVLMSVLNANAKEVKDASLRFGRGLTTVYRESIKRAYYRAALVTTQLQEDSFSQDFKLAARALADRLLANSPPPRSEPLVHRLHRRR
jgi:hypothetical protein